MERTRFESEIRDLLQEFESVQPDMVCFFLLDPSGVFKNRQSLMAKIVARLENKFNALDQSWLKTTSFKFVAAYKPGEPSDKQKAGFRKLDFPIYLLDKQHTEGVVTDLMEKHKIPKTGGRIDYYKYARESWKNEGVRGLGIPSEAGHRKVGFIKTHKVFDQARDWPLGFANCITHEIGHMGNKFDHSPKGIMKYPVPLDVDLTFDTGDRNWFFGNLVRLKRLYSRVVSLNWKFR